MENKTLKFPKGFLWGAATSAYQVEGGNRNDWSEWEKKNAKRLAGEAKNKWAKWQQKRFPEMFDPQNYICGRACDHYNRFDEDLDIAKSLGLNAFRISVEWSRIEPEEGKFDEREIEHYKKVLEAIRARGMEPFVTLWHFTNPLWLEEIGGLECSKFPFFFCRYAGKVFGRIGNFATYWTTFNEPTVILLNSYLIGAWPPTKKNIFTAFRVYRNFGKAHDLAYDMLHKMSESVQISLVSAINYLEAKNKNSILDKLSTFIAEYIANGKMLRRVKHKNDFIGLNYYVHKKIRFPFYQERYKKNTSDLDWGISPGGIYHVLKNLRKYDLPIFITENGLADAEDKKRAKFIKDHLYCVHKAISEGADVRGYFHWSLLDNFEWDKGFWPRFGLVEVDYKTMERKIRPSALEYAKICKNNHLQT
ncbi:MAG: glycoside hydrolase family 1 protein [Candidatus Moranbacteria bacterium]|nr:glycoside hydrolase family 1 protein [Candidatus Moranbacteria bacterium]